MHEILDDVRKDAMKKFKLTGEKDKKQLTDAAVLMLKIELAVEEWGLLATVIEIDIEREDEFLKKILWQMSDGTAPALTLEAAINEYWAKDPQGILAMVFYIYLLGADCIYDMCPFTTMMKSLRTLLPEECYGKFDRQVDKMNKIRKKRKQKQQKRLYLFEQKESLQRQKGESYVSKN